ncbi:hypothetical protein D3C84_1088880 [compost metagenome]
MKMLIEHTGRSETARPLIEAPRRRVQVDAHQEYPGKSQVVGKLQSQVGDGTGVKKTTFEILAETQGFVAATA